jgi:hypothetical protein
MKEYLLAASGEKRQWQEFVWTAVLFLFAFLDIRTFIQGGAGLPALFHSPALHWSPFEVLIQCWHVILLISFLVSAALLFARSRFSVALGIGQAPWRLLCFYRSFEGIGIENTLVAHRGGAVVELLIPFGIEVVRILLTVYAIRYFKHHGLGSLHPAGAITAVLVVLVLFDRLDRHEHGIVRWRLDDGSLMWVTPVDEQSYWLARAYGGTKTMMRRYAPGELTEATLIRDKSWNYWVLAKAGDEMAQYPIFFNTKTQAYGPQERWEGDPPRGERVAPARSALFPF